MAEERQINLIGKTILQVRPMTKEEKDINGWCQENIVIVLSDGTKLFPSCDYEGNAPGAIFGTTIDGYAFAL